MCDLTVPYQIGCVSHRVTERTHPRAHLLHLRHFYFFFFPFFFFTPPPVGPPAAGAILEPGGGGTLTPSVLDVSCGTPGCGCSGSVGAVLLFCIFRIRVRFNVSKRFKNIDE